MSADQSLGPGGDLLQALDCPLIRAQDQAGRRSAPDSGLSQDQSLVAGRDLL